MIVSEAIDAIDGARYLGCIIGSDETVHWFTYGVDELGYTVPTNGDAPFIVYDGDLPWQDTVSPERLVYLDTVAKGTRVGHLLDLIGKATMAPGEVYS